MADTPCKRQKICFAASSGGHLEEITRLTGVREGHDCFLITEYNDYQETGFCEKIYSVKQANRKQITFIFDFIGIFFKCVRILRAEKVGCVITTGALTGCTAALAGKFLRKKVIYIESFARVDTPSLTGRLLYPVADLFIVQWEEGLKFFPKAVYGGGIF